MNRLLRSIRSLNRRFMNDLLNGVQDAHPLLISHRLSSVRTCDRILVLDNGRIVEDGDHETLLAQDGLYAQFFRAQAQWYV